jgi:hypothetical protein
VNILKASVVATHVIPELRRLRQRDLEFQASLGNTASPYFKKKKRGRKKKISAKWQQWSHVA